MKTFFWFSFFVFVSADEIINLPGIDFELNFKQYSGYLDASPTRKLHYWFVESQNDPSTDPVIFWFNGGPGCSSLFGLLQELGPFLINSDGKTLHKNEYSWNRNASVVFLESPAGVGFSYSTDGNITTNDDLSAIQNYEAIKQFYSKYPQFYSNDIYIAGESYAGVYIPTLAVQIIGGLKKFHLNLKGIAIGNGFVSSQLSYETDLLYKYYHGLIDEQEWAMNCCNGKLEGCDLGSCNQEYGTRVEVNVYDIHSKCRDIMPDFSQLIRNSKHQTRNLWSHRENQTHSSKVEDESNQECVSNRKMKQYLNTPDVRRSLNIPSSVGEWKTCNNNLFIDDYQSPRGSEQSENIKKIVGKKIRTLLYYGDLDAACNFLMGQKFSHQLGLEKISSKSAWFYDDGIIGGYKTDYDYLTFLTVNGAGHMVPQTHPRPMQHILQRFIEGFPI